jgi:hypothetical protein
MNDAGDEYPEDYLVGLVLFERGDWFESHHAWEECWRGAGPEEADFYKGLIHLAVGLCHRYNGNVRGARKLAGSSRAYLRRFEPHWRGLDVAAINEAAAECFAGLESADPMDPPPIDLSLVPRLSLSPPPAAWPIVPDPFPMD